MTEERRYSIVKRKISWTRRCEDGVKRETRVTISRGGIKWQFKRADEERWNYSLAPTEEEWDILEEILRRRISRGRGINLMESLRKFRGDG